MALPSDVLALFASAANKNGLQSVGSAPWHSKASYGDLNDNGSVKESGTFEEFWASEKNLKTIYSRPSFNHTDYSTDAGVFRVGNSNWPDEAEALVEQSFFPLFPSEENSEKVKFKLNDRGQGSVKLRCVTGENSWPVPVSSGSLYCFSQDTPAPRVLWAAGGLYAEVYNRMASFRSTTFRKKSM